jgi:hypothetical protein
MPTLNGAPQMRRSLPVSGRNVSSDPSQAIAAASPDRSGSPLPPDNAVKV